MKRSMVFFVSIFAISSIFCLGNGSSIKSKEDIFSLMLEKGNWPVLKQYDQDHLGRIALPLGGIGTGTISLGGRGDLRDWEIMNRPSIGFIPVFGQNIGPFFMLFVRTENGETKTRLLEGPLELSEFENSHGSTAVNHGLPRFRNCRFAAAYPLGQVLLSDPDMPVYVRLEAFNPLIPPNTEKSGIPVAVLRYVLYNPTENKLDVSICGTLPNFIGRDGSQKRRDWKGDLVSIGGEKNCNEFRTEKDFQGIFMTSEGVDPKAEQWGSIAIVSLEKQGLSNRTAWLKGGWGTPLLDFWDDFSSDGILEARALEVEDMPPASLAVSVELLPKSSKSFTFLIFWHFPNRFTWTPNNTEEDLIKNYYTTRYTDAWDVAKKTVPDLLQLENSTVDFVRTFCDSSLPQVVKEAALFNLSTLRTQTCFRTADGRFFGFEGSSNSRGCCHGSCTHVWNYEQAIPFLFGSLALSMREVEFGHATDAIGLMSFRVALPLERAQNFGKAAADGQMGCIMKMYRDWQLSGNDEFLKSLWPQIKKALEFCWIPGGWDADMDGVMEGCQHNTMDVEYYGPNPQMEIWYLGALRACEEMADHIGEKEFANVCHRLFEKGSNWTDKNLFNGEYYEQIIRPPKDISDIAPSLLIGMGAKDPLEPEYQLGTGCLVDQLVGQYMAHVCGLGYLTHPQKVKKTLESVFEYNRNTELFSHFNCMRSFALGDEAALLMASYPKGRPHNPFPYFTEVMTGFEYTAAVGMLFEDQTRNGLQVIENIRDRYDGKKRSPFDEAECGHHYARAMASWGAILALSGFQYSALEKSLCFSDKPGDFFWSNGYAWGNCSLTSVNKGFQVELSVNQGELLLAKFQAGRRNWKVFDNIVNIKKGEKIQFFYE